MAEGLGTGNRCEHSSRPKTDTYTDGTVNPETVAFSNSFLLVEHMNATRDTLPVATNICLVARRSWQSGHLARTNSAIEPIR
jgi:hypothetical protein